MKPPYYHTIIEILSRKERSGVPAEVESEMESVRKTCLESIAHGSYNRQAWANFVTTNPSDKAAQYMRKFVQ